jgi:hypothetical protein
VGLASRGHPVKSGMEKYSKQKKLWGWLILAVIILAVVAGIGAFWARSVLQQNSEAYSAEIARTEETYIANLNSWLGRPDDPRETFDVQIFLSARILEKIADTVEGQTLQFGDGQSLKIDTLRFELRTGFPLVHLSGVYHGGKKGVSFGGDVAAVLELASHEDTYILRIRPLTVRPAFGIGAIRVALSGLLGDVTQQIARDYAASWPGIELPVQTLVPVRIPALDTEVKIKIRGKEGDPWIKVKFDFPKLETDLKIVYEGLVFTKEGIHLFANLEKADQDKAREVLPSGEWQAMNREQKIAAIGFGDRDLGSRLSKRVFAFAVARVAEMPAANRIIHIRGEERSGNIMSSDLGPVHYDVWLENPPKTQGVMRVDRLTSEVSQQKDEIIRYRARGMAELKGQLGARISFGKPKDATTRQKMKDDNPIPVKFDPTEIAISGRFMLTRDGQLPIIAIMIDPAKEIETSCRIKLPILGHITIHPQLSLPEARMTRIKLPPTFETQGEVQIGERAKIYRIAIDEMQWVGDTNYLALTANAALELGGK